MRQRIICNLHSTTRKPEDAPEYCHDWRPDNHADALKINEFINHLDAFGEDMEQYGEELWDEYDDPHGEPSGTFGPTRDVYTIQELADAAYKIRDWLINA
jgi:hypothetical protein